eukprot:TRINITY_DN811_c0_g1_i1.p1 TRINITY_DN811_c0_g1~~TRINITY_DN811_c0_g1_i1.p1  ORF type:complete len:226 (+),score=47.65 TRINITY_DN811_c0_g1_i1:80-757(+)
MLIKLIFVVFLLFPVSSFCSQCSAYQDCGSCATDSTCRWCPVTNTCHTFGSLMNKCRFYENLSDPKLCTCNCKPTRNFGPEICGWYTEKSPSLSPNPAYWKGGDFLPNTYGSAATCACGGEGNPFWQLDAPSCVRSYLIKGHENLPSQLKVDIRNATLSGVRSRLLPYVETFYQMHVDAYNNCCCPGKPAPFATWVMVFYAGNLLPCKTGILPMVMEFSRCGCGW